MDFASGLGDAIQQFELIHTIMWQLHLQIIGQVFCNVLIFQSLW